MLNYFRPIIFFFPLLLNAQSLEEDITSHLPELEKHYIYLHQYPELSFQEEKTAVYLKNEFEKLGYKVTANMGGYGLVAVMENGKGPCLMIRADMDALPVKEESGKTYASKAMATDINGNEVPVMHACGHDVHMTSLLGTAKMLSKHKNEWKGTLVLIAQPAEERGAGARKMIADGLFERFPRPDNILALHVMPYLKAGAIEYCPEYALASVDMVNITVYGIGGHGAYPHLAKDPIVIASKLVLELQTIISREISALDPAVITVGSIHGGTKANIIPDEVKLELTVRSYKEEVRQHLLEGIKRTAKGVGIGAGLPEDRLPKVEISNESSSAVYNSPELCNKVVPVFEEILGKENVRIGTPHMGGEDFAEYGRVEPKIPIFIYLIGASNADEIAKGIEQPSIHSPFFAPDYKPTIKTGVYTMTSAALKLLTP